jgi:hypothetical protein
MKLNFPLPIWLLRWLVRRNPWLLSDSGKVTRSRTLDLGLLDIDVTTAISLDPVKKARLLAEAAERPSAPRE